MPAFEPKDPDFRARVAASFTRQAAMASLGITIARLDAGEIELAMPEGAAVLTVEFKTNLLAPAKGECFTFHGQVVKPGRTLTVCEARAFAHESGVSRLAATMTATLMAIFDRDGINS